MPTYPTREACILVRMEIKTVVFGGMQMPSLIVLKQQGTDDKQQVNLPIRIGPIEAASITAGIEERQQQRPLTHDLMASVLDTLGARLNAVTIVDVQGTTFFATLQLTRVDGSKTELDCRPSDAIALAVRKGVPIYAREQVIDTATMPDFQKVEQAVKEDDLAAFHDFVESLNPEDFA